MKALRLLSTAVLCVSLSSICLADNLKMPNSNSSAEKHLPKRGMTKQQVESNFGTPESKHGPRGTPPIYYWEYQNFTVYFESNMVLHSVVKFQAKAEMETESKP